MATKDITDQQVCQAYADCAPPPETDWSTALHEWATGNLTLADRPWPYELLMQRTGQPENVCYRACERAERHGLVEYGVSLRAGWLTQKGKALLDAMEPTTG